MKIQLVMHRNEHVREKRGMESLFRESIGFAGACGESDKSLSGV